MSSKTLTLKSTSRNLKTTTTDAHAARLCVVAGRSPKGKSTDGCPAVIAHLNELIKERRPVFVQMRHGTGYRGVPTQLQDGWLAMTNVSIHGTKQTATSQSILIQLRDGSFIAHLHPVDAPCKEGVQK